MYVTVIINRGTINITNPSEIKSGTTELLSSGDRKILFADFGYSDYSDENYDVVLGVFNANGVRSGYVLGSLEADGININLSYDSFVHFITNKK